MRNFVLNSFAATSQILLNLYARQCKFHFKILCRSSAASTLAPQNISQMYPPRAVKTRLHQTARHAAHDPSVFGVRHGYSRCKSVAANDCNTPLLAFSTQRTFHSCTRARQAKSAATSPACVVARRFMSARRDLKFRSAVANFKISKFKKTAKF